jgi:RHS repeat-associated protein
VLGQVVFEVNQNMVLRAYVNAAGKVIAQQSRDGQFYWLHTNHLGSGTKMTDTEGVVKTRMELDPYGQTLLEWSSSGDTYINTKKYTGYERDEATGLDYASARIYSNGRGRFMRPDPKGLEAADIKKPQSLNRYAYVGNDPVNFVDPGGLYEQAWWWGAYMDFMSFYIYAMFLDSPPPAPIPGDPPPPEPEQDPTKNVGFIKDAAKDLSKKKLDKKDCQDTLSKLGITADQVRAGAQAANIMNGVGSTVSLSSLYATSPDPTIQQNANTITGTVGDRLATPGTVAVAQLGGPAIYVDPAKFNVADYWTNLSIVFHEVLHNVTGLTDPDIQRKLGLDESKPSHNITEKLKKDCF